MLRGRAKPGVSQPYKPQRRYLGMEISISVLFSFLALLFSFMGCAQTKDPHRTESVDLYPIMQNGRFGYVNGKGRVVIKPQFLKVDRFSEGLAVVVIGTPEDYRYGFIDTTGRIVFETDASPSEKGFSSGVAVLLAKNSASHYFIDRLGRFITGYYLYAEDCTEGLCAVKMESGQWGFVDTSGETVIKGQYDWAKPFSNGIARVGVLTASADIRNDGATRDSKMGFIDRNGKAITPMKFDTGADFSDGLAQVKLDNKWGYINQSGEIAIPPQFEQTYSFRDGLARVKVNGLWGYIDKSGKMTIPAQFEFADDFYESWASVRKAGRAFYVARAGRTTLTTPFQYLGRFRNGKAGVKLNNKVGLINKFGKVIVALKFESLEMMSDELILVEDENGFGYINYDGVFIWRPTR